MKFLQTLLLPVSYLYGGLMQFRNFLYNQDIFHAFHFETRVISVGNLRVGGTGKSPHVEYLIRLLSPEFHVTTLSRGYGRRSKGFRIAGPADSASTIGDEPYQYHSKFPEINVTVGEERAVAIPFILAELPQTNVILMDDAFQHRPVRPDLQVLITEYHRPFYSDTPLPSGRLREPKAGAARADIVIVSKCPSNLVHEDEVRMKNKIRMYNRHAPVYFTSLVYGAPLPLWNKDLDVPVIVITGIGNPLPFEQYISGNYEVVKMKRYSDHHRYSKKDVNDLVKLARVHAPCRIFLTEKDAVKLGESRFQDTWEDVPVSYIPIQVRFLHDAELFNSTIEKVAAIPLKDAGQPG